MFGRRFMVLRARGVTPLGIVALLVMSFALGEAVQAAEAPWPALELGDTAPTHRLDDYLWHCWAAASEDVPPEAHLFKPLGDDTLMLGLGSSPYWIGFRARNASDETIQRVVTIVTGMVADIRVMTLGEGNSVLGTDLLGYQHVVDPVALRAANYSSAISLAPGQERTILVRVSTSVPVQAHLEISAPQDYLVAQQSAALMRGLYLGAMLVMALYHLISYFLSRETSYLFFTGYVFSLFALFAMDRGVLGTLLQLLDTPELLSFSWFPFIILAQSASLTGFAWTFLRIGEAPRWVKVNLCWPLILTLIASSVAALGATESIQAWVYAAAYLNGVMILLVSFWLWRVGQDEAAWVCLTRILVQLGAVLMLLSSYGFVSRGFVVDNIVWIAVGLEAMILSLLLPYRYRLMSAERDFMTEVLEHEVQRYDGVVEQNESLRTGLEELIEARRTHGSSLEQLQEERMQRQDSLRDANQQLAQIDRRVSLGRLVAGVAHDMANPATHIAGSQRIIQMSLQSLDANAEIHAVLEREVEGLTCQLALIEDNSREIVSVNQALTRYSRNSEEALTITLSEMMESIALILKGRLQGVEFDVSVAQAPRAVSRRGQLAQVVVNLLQNAIDSVEKRPDGERKIGVNAKEIQIEEGERCIELIVEDSGRGVPEYLVRNIFRPFVTGGHPGHRMGLGLSTAERIINVRGGSIRVGSSLKLKGASFVVIVPLVERST